MMRTTSAAFQFAGVTMHSPCNLVIRLPLSAREPWFRRIRITCLMAWISKIKESAMKTNSPTTKVGRTCNRKKQSCNVEVAVLVYKRGFQQEIYEISAPFLKLNKRSIFPKSFIKIMSSSFQHQYNITHWSLMHQ